MKIGSQAFPYPILGHGRDFTDSTFQCGLKIKLIEESKYLKIGYSFMLSNDEIQTLIDKNQASFALEIICKETLFRKVYKRLPQIGEFELRSADFHGKLEVLPLIVVTDSDIKFTGKDLNPEFGGRVFELQPGDVIAFGDPFAKYIEFNKLSFESLVRITVSADLPDFEYKFEASSTFIKILVGRKMKELCDELKNRNGVPHLAMSVYKDCVLFALGRMAEQDEEAEDAHWAKALNAKISHVDEELPQENDLNALNVLAQRLLEERGARKLYGKLSK